MDQSSELSLTSDNDNDNRPALSQQITAESTALLHLLTLISGELDELNKMTKENGRLDAAVNEGINSLETLAKVGGMSLAEEDIKKLILNGDTIPNITEVNSTITQNITNT